MLREIKGEEPVARHCLSQPLTVVHQSRLHHNEVDKLELELLEQFSILYRCTYWNTTNTMTPMILLRVCPV